MSKGNLIEAPGKHLWNFLEILDSFGTTPEHLEAFRKSSSWRQITVAEIVQGDPLLWALLGMEGVAKAADFTEADFKKMAGSPDLMRQLLAVVRGTASEPPEKKWREKNGVIYFSVTSDGTTGEEWIARLESKGFRLNNYAESVLHSKDFKPTSGVTTKIAILKGMLFSDSDDRITKNIRAEARKRNFITPNAEIACLIREKFTDEEIKAMGLVWIVAMHESIKNSVGQPSVLSASRSDSRCGLNACWNDPEGSWNREGGFAFAVQQ